MQLPAKQALVCWVSFMVLIIGALMVFLGPPASQDGAAESIGHVIALTGFAALGSWLLARRKTPSWSWGKFVLVYMASAIVVAALAAYGNRSHAAEQQSFGPRLRRAFVAIHVYRRAGPEAATRDRLVGSTTDIGQPLLGLIVRVLPETAHVAAMVLE